MDVPRNFETAPGGTNRLCSLATHDAGRSEGEGLRHQAVARGRRARGSVGSRGAQGALLRSSERHRKALQPEGGNGLPNCRFDEGFFVNG